jgi:hypothetical protein
MKADNKKRSLQKSILITGTVNCSLVETKTLFNQEYSVLPVVMMVEGSYQPFVEELSEPAKIYFSSHELKASARAWNGRPACINHPEGVGTFNSPENYEKSWVGFVFNVRYEDTKRRLKGDLWVEEGRGSFIKEMVKKGDHVDVSIGVFSDLVPSNNKESDFMLTNITPDHLAILPDSKGACNWGDGCGIRAKESEAKEILVARTPDYDGREDIPWAEVDKSLTAFSKGYQANKKLLVASDDGKNTPNLVGSEIDKLSKGEKQWIASKTLLGSPQASSVEDLLFLPVVNPITNKLNIEALKEVASGKVKSMGNSMTKASAVSKAESLLNSNPKRTIKGEKMTECAEQNTELEKQKKMEVPAPSKKLSMKEYLDQAPDEYRDYMVNSMKAYEANKAKNISVIVSCKAVKFCEEALNNVSDMSLLESISSLVSAFDNYEQNNKKGVASDDHDYQLRAQTAYDNYSPKLDYVPFYDAPKK